MASKQDHEARRLLYKISTLESSLKEASSTAQSLMPRLDKTTAKIVETQLKERSSSADKLVNGYVKKLGKLLEKGANPFA